MVINAGQDANYFGEFVGKQKAPQPEEVTGKKKRKKKNEGSQFVRRSKLPVSKSVYVRVAQVERKEKKCSLATLPRDQRMGILTHPSWLIAHSTNFDNHAIDRGRWIREKLLGGRIPEIPVTVDAVLPEMPDKTLRERMRVTREESCWTCHQQMDPLGLPSGITFWF